MACIVCSAMLYISRMARYRPGTFQVQVVLPLSLLCSIPTLPYTLLTIANDQLCFHKYTLSWLLRRRVIILSEPLKFVPMHIKSPSDGHGVIRIHTIPEAISWIHGRGCCVGRSYHTLVCIISANNVSSTPGTNLTNKTEIGAWLSDKMRY